MKTKTTILNQLKGSIELRLSAEMGDNSPWAHHYEQPISHYTVISSIVNIEILTNAALKLSAS